MPTIDPELSFSVLKDSVIKSVSSYFPYEGRNQKLVLKNIWADDKLSVDDIRSQAEAKDKEKTWGVPIKGDLELIDKATGKVIDSKTMTLSRLPKMTSRYGFIVDGNEYQVDHLFRLKSGVYARIQQNGDIKSEFNLASGNGFSVFLDRKKKQFQMKMGSTHIPLYPILHSLGVSDDQLQVAWGKEILAANKPKDQNAFNKSLHSFYSKTGDQAAPADLGKAVAHVKDWFSKTQLRPDTTKVTLGKAFDSVNGETLQLATAKLLGVARGTVQPDDRDNLSFKEVVSVEDFIPEKIKRADMSIKGRLRHTVDRKKSVLEIVSPDLFARPVMDFFKKSGSITERSEQTNPLQMLAGHHKTTLIAPDFGGMKSEHSLIDEMRVINPSHFGFLDPMHTPESSRTGITLHMNLSTQKIGKDLVSPVFDKETGKLTYLNPAQFHDAKVVLPDQVRWEKGIPKPISSEVKIKHEGGDIHPSKFSDARYVMPSTKGVFGIASNLIPFLPCDQGNRVSMADKQMEQAISLKHREPPLVQSMGPGVHTFDHEVGRFTSISAPVDGKVVAIKKDAIVIGDGRKKHEVHIYDHFPLNDAKGMLHSTPTVQVGDSVKKGQLLADSNYTKGGTLALGTNLRVGYIPYKGYNFEDGIVISESAAKKLTSEHLHRRSLEVDPDTDIVSKSKFLVHASLKAKSIPQEHINALDDEGIIKPGTKVVPGQVMVAALKKNTQKIAEFGKRSWKPWKDNSIVWDEDHVGEVIKVVKSPTGKDVKVYVKTEEPLVIGDKLSGRHGNKGIVTMILPDHEMPHTKDEKGEAKPLEVLLNPHGVPSRINIGQAMETAVGKIAEKTGKVYKVDNFAGPSHIYHEQVMKDLKAHGISDEEKVYDPNDPNHALGSVLVGPQYLMKLKHQVEKKLSVRGGGTDLNRRPLPVDVDRQPTRGSGNSGQSLGQLDAYVLLGHNARANLREAATYKSDLQDAGFWSMIQEGYEPPPPKVPFAYEKFTGLLKGLGVNIEKHGTQMRIQPLTDKEIIHMAGGPKGEIKNANMTLRAKDLREEKHGLFDIGITGGREGTKWGFIRLNEPIPNPIFVGSGNQTGPVPTLLGMKLDDVEKVMRGEMEINGKTGGHAIEGALKKLDVDKEIDLQRAKLKSVTRGAELDRANKKLRYLLALKEVGMKPHEAYVLHTLPVLPPVFRPVTETENGDVHASSLNGLYKNIAVLNQKVGEFDHNIMPVEMLHPLRHSLYESVKAFQSVGGTVGYDTDSPGGKRSLKGILAMIGGGEKDSGEKTQPKEGYFQRKLVARRQNLSIRSTIIPEPKLGLDEVGIPRNAAMELYKPYVVVEMKKMGVTALDAQDHMKKGSDIAFKALEKAIADRPLMLKRDPALHKFNILSFKPRLVEGKAIQIHPLVCGGFNADFDGDTMSGFVPMSKEAVEEAKQMFPSKNLFSPTSGGPMFMPVQESMLGLHLLTKWGKTTNHKFDTVGDAKKAYEAHKIAVDDVVTVKGAKGATTVGRLMLAEKLPSGFKLNSDVLHSPTFTINKKVMNSIADIVAREHPREFSETVDGLKNLGNEHVYRAGFSFGLRDIAPLPGRKAILDDAQKKAEHIKKTVTNRDDRDSQVIATYQDATTQLDELSKKFHATSGNRLAQMVYTGSKGKPEQLRQMIAAPMLMQDGSGRTLMTPVTRSYAEGLDVGDYWQAQHGARKGTLQRTLGTSEPGVVSKDIINATMSTLIVSKDCGTSQGVLMRLTPPTKDGEDDRSHKDVHDRFLATQYKLHDGTIAKPGDLITPELSAKLRKSGHEKVLARSPLKCQHGDGICSKCFGLNENGRLHEVGTNIGVLAGQALSEPAVQMAMDSFHSGGLAQGRGAESVDRMTRLSHLLEIPKKLKNAATLSRIDGKVVAVTKDAAGGHDVMVQPHAGGELEKHYVPYPTKLKVGVGSEVSKSHPLSDGPINPRHLLPLSDIHRVQKYLTDEMYNELYDKEGVRRRNVEVVVRSMTNLTKVKDPGTSELLHGDVTARSVVDEHNRNLKPGEKPIIHEPVLHGIKQVSTGVGSTDWMARLNYQRLAQTIMQGAAQAWKSDIHSSHPIPAYARGSEFGRPPADLKEKKPHVY
jgi:DNA-directed RNA polymerase subunit beta'